MTERKYRNLIMNEKEQMKNLDKYRGCLIGGAAGDALGYAIEFFDEETIFQKFGESGIPDKYKKNLELYDIIIEIADDLYNDCQMYEHSDYTDEVWISKYVKRTYPKLMKDVV